MTAIEVLELMDSWGVKGITKIVVSKNGAYVEVDGGQYPAWVTMDAPEQQKLCSALHAYRTRDYVFEVS